MKRAVTFLYIFVLCLSFPLPSLAQEKTIEPAKVCRKCHREIYEQWKSSRHANSFTEPTFRESFEAVRGKNADSASLCLFCHGPVATFPKDTLGIGLTVKEGITCDFCHTVDEVATDGKFPRYSNTPGTKRGPIDNTTSSYHTTEFSPLLLDAKFCAGCHEFTNQNGTPILTTYSEWEKSFYRGEGVHCQYCHLPQLYKDIQYLPGTKNPDSPPDHTMRGGHYPEKLREAIRMSGTLRRKSKKAILHVVVKNDKSGHKIPTGIPTHKIIIAAKLFDGEGETIGDKQVYIERILGDSEGNALTFPADIFLKASTVLKDNRIEPKEAREFTIDFPLKKRLNTLSAGVSLLYELPSPDPNLKKVRISFDTRTIPLSGPRFPFRTIIILLLAVTAALIIYDILIRLKAGKQ